MKLTKITILATILIAAIACNKDEFNREKLVINDELTINTKDPLVVKLLEMGYKLQNIKEYNDYYIVENDMLYFKNSQNNQKQAYTNQLVNLDKVNVITLKIDNSIPTTGSWRQIIIDAVNDWNNITDCRINFVITTGTTADIYVVSDTSITNPMIAAMPGNGNPGQLIKINLNHASLQNITDLRKKRAVIHELGHTIGFMHSDGIANGESNNPLGYNTIPYTPPGTVTNLDINSVMNSYLTNAVGFSSYDLISAKYLYPDYFSITNTITYPTEGVTEVNNGGGVSLYWKPTYISSSNIKLEIYREGILIKNLTVLNNGYYEMNEISNSALYKIKISSITNPTSFDEVNFEYIMD